MRMGIHSSMIKERRKKRVVTPALYFLLEMVFMWLVLSLIEVKFNPREWAVWAFAIFAIWGLYSFGKMVHVYQRQRDYKE